MRKFCDVHAAHAARLVEEVPARPSATAPGRRPARSSRSSGRSGGRSTSARRPPRAPARAAGSRRSRSRSRSAASCRTRRRTGRRPGPGSRRPCRRSGSCSGTGCCRRTARSASRRRRLAEQSSERDKAITVTASVRCTRPSPSVSTRLRRRAEPDVQQPCGSRVIPGTRRIRKRRTRGGSRWARRTISSTDSHAAVPAQVPEPFAELLSRRQVLQRATALRLGGLVLSALPAAERFLGAVEPAAAAAEPRRRDAAGVRRHADPGPHGPAAPTSATRSTRKAIAGVHPEPGAVEADALLLFHSPLIGFDALEPAFLAELETRSLPRGGPVPRPAVRQARRGLRRRPRSRRTRACGVGGGGGRAVRGVPGRGDAAERHDRHRLRATR